MRVVWNGSSLVYVQGLIIPSDSFADRCRARYSVSLIGQFCAPSIVTLSCLSVGVPLGGRLLLVHIARSLRGDHCHLYRPGECPHLGVGVITYTEGGRGAAVLDVLTTHPLQVITRLHLYLQTMVLASGGQDGTICLWDVLTGSRVGLMHGHRGDITSLLCTASYVISSGLDDVISIWDRSSGIKLYSIQQVSYLPDATQC